MTTRTDLVVEFYNKCHVPSGPGGGRFCSAGVSGAKGSASGKRMSVKQLASVRTSSFTKVRDDADNEALGAYERYIGDMYQPVNAAMRGNMDAKTRKAGRPLVEAMKRAFDAGAVELPGAASLYRGVRLSPKEVDSMFTEGSEFVDKGFVSTSSNRARTSHFRTSDDAVAADYEYGRDKTGSVPVLMRINAPKGTKVLAGEATESEFILSPNTKFRVTKVVRTAKGVEAFVDVVSSPSRLTKDIGKPSKGSKAPANARVVGKKQMTKLSKIASKPVMDAYNNGLVRVLNEQDKAGATMMSNDAAWDRHMGGLEAALKKAKPGGPEHRYIQSLMK